MKSKKNWNDFIASKKFKYTLFAIAVILLIVYLQLYMGKITQKLKGKC